MTLEEQLFDFATVQLVKAKTAFDAFERRKANSPDEYSDSDGSIVKYDLQHWNSVCSLIVKKYGLEGSFGVMPITNSKLAGTLSYWLAYAQDTAEALATVLDEAQSARETAALEHRLQSIRGDLARAKQMANFYAFIMGVNHPFPGVDMLPADIPAAA